MQVPLILAGNNVRTDEHNVLEQLDDYAPRQDYAEIARRLGGKLSGYDLFYAVWYYWAPQIQKHLKLDLVEPHRAGGQRPSAPAKRCGAGAGPRR